MAQHNGYGVQFCLSLSINPHELHVGSRRQTNFTSTEKRKQETGTDLPTNGMFLRGTKDNNLFQLHASIPENQGKTLGGTIRCQLQNRGCWVCVKVAIALLLSTGQEPCLNQRPPSITALSERQPNGYN